MKASKPLWIALALYLLIFYGPILLSAGSVVTSTDSDPVGHMLISLGDSRPGGRFFHYFDLSANARLWGNDLKYNPLHLIRLISIALGSNLIGWGILIAMLHSLLFLVVYSYSRKVFKVSATAALAGATVAFFATSWLEWTALVYWTASAVLLAVSIGEYWLWIVTARRRHLLLCILANVLQPYVTQCQALIPLQAYLLGAVFLMAWHRKGARASTLSPLILRVWPLTVLGWMPILAPVAFTVVSGLTTREALKPVGWGFHGSFLTEFLGLLFPASSVMPTLLSKLGWSAIVAAPNAWLFGSFLFIPAILALWQSGRKPLRILVIGVLFYCASVLAGDSLSFPWELANHIGFARVFAFPVLSGFVVAAAFDLPAFCSPETKGLKILYRFYKILLCATAIGFTALLRVDQNTLTNVGSRFGLIGSGTEIPSMLRSTRVFAAGIALGLAGYFCFIASKRKLVLSSLALLVTIAAPAFCFGYGERWYERPPELDAMLSPPPEIRFLRERIPNHAYRVGIVLASEMQLAQGDWKGFWRMGVRREERILSGIRENDLRLRQGLAFALSPLHFFAPAHNQLRGEGNPFLQRPDSPEAPFLNRRNIIVRPETQGFEEYGVRYWLSNFDLDRLHPQKFTRVYQGEVAAVFENQDAKPVAYFLDEPAIPLPLEHAPYGAAIAIPENKQGELSVHLDLRKMDARAVDRNGHPSPLMLKASGPRWVVDVPPGSSSVIFTAQESAPLRLLAAGSGAAFLLLFALMSISKGQRNGTGPRDLLS